MNPKAVVIVAMAILASAVIMPAIDAEASDTEIFTYYSQLDINSSLVYKAVNEATAVDGDTKEFTVVMKELVTKDDTDKAKEYAEGVVRNGLTALYLSNPMIPYIWNYPVAEVVVTPEISTETIKEVTYYILDSVTFSLSVPEGITAESMDKLNEAIKSFSISGSTDADKVKNIMSELNKLYFKEDEEGTISNIYNALVDRQTTSAGVAQAFAVLCKLNNIPVLTVSGHDILADDKEKISFWNYVYLEGDVDGETKKSWYIVDSTYAVSTGIAGYLTEVTHDGKTYSMSSALYTDLALTGEVQLSVPQLEKNKYVQVGGIPFWEKYGEMILIAVIGVVIVGAMIYAVRAGIVN